jgi:hypothetical protein
MEVGIGDLLGFLLAGLGLLDFRLDTLLVGFLARFEVFLDDLFPFLFGHVLGAFGEFFLVWSISHDYNKECSLRQPLYLVATSGFSERFRSPNSGQE